MIYAFSPTSASAEMRFTGVGISMHLPLRASRDLPSNKSKHFPRFESRSLVHTTYSFGVKALPPEALSLGSWLAVRARASVLSPSPQPRLNGCCARRPISVAQRAARVRQAPCWAWWQSLVRAALAKNFLRFVSNFRIPEAS
eukprot:6043356-Pleurochrysis_carterae.AAC.3